MCKAVNILDVSPDSNPSYDWSISSSSCLRLVVDVQHWSEIIFSEWCWCCMYVGHWLTAGAHIFMQHHSSRLKINDALLIYTRLMKLQQCFSRDSCDVMLDWNIVAFTSSFISILTQDALFLCSVYSLHKGAFGW